MDSKADVGDACRLVRQMIADVTARVSVAVETGPDEAVLVGTTDAYLRLALVALEFVADALSGRADQNNIGGTPVAQTVSVGAVFAPGEFGLSAAWLTETTAEASAVADYMRRLSPPANGS